MRATPCVLLVTEQLTQLYAANRFRQLTTRRRTIRRWRNDTAAAAAAARELVWRTLAGNQLSRLRRPASTASRRGRQTESLVAISNIDPHTLWHRVTDATLISLWAIGEWREHGTNTVRQAVNGHQMTSVHQHNVLTADTSETTCRYLRPTRLMTCPNFQAMCYNAKVVYGKYIFDPFHWTYFKLQQGYV